MRDLWRDYRRFFRRGLSAHDRIASNLAFAAVNLVAAAAGSFAAAGMELWRFVHHAR